MKEKGLWEFIIECLQNENPIIFMCVLDSRGSSPGRRGYKMAVTKDKLIGSIGGGIMEHKFVLMARESLINREQLLFTKNQIHNSNALKNRSGMICSGEQRILLFTLTKKVLPTILTILNVLQENQSCRLIINPKGFELKNDFNENSEKEFIYKNEEEWQYSENLGWSDYLYIIGGGHCSLALSRVMRDLGFFVHVIDERQNLNTMEQNEFANKLETINSFEDIEKHISSNKKIYLVVMTIGYRSDALVLKKLLHKNFFYAGLLGSEAKVKKLKSELFKEGIDSSKLEDLNAPIGIPINSRSPEEIAISIAAQIIAKKNAQLI